MKRSALQLDSRILTLVAKGADQFYKIGDALNDTDYRKVDRQLQSLRKRGLLKYDRKNGWTLA